MTTKKTIADISNWQGVRALVRVDYNVPLNPTGEITDDTRIKETLPTLNYLLKAGAKVVIMAHFGRPKGKIDETMRLTPVATRLAQLLPGVTVNTLKTVVGEEATQAVNAMPNGSVVMLENTRFEPGEESNDPTLAAQLAQLGDVFVNDAFGAAHRGHASTEGVGHVLKQRVAGLLMAKELDALGNIVANPAKPFVAIVGGSKISTKIGVLAHMLDKVSAVVLGGAMIFTFMQAKGLSVGSSKWEPEELETAKQFLQQAEAKGVTVWLPSDLVVADAFSNDANRQVVSANAVPEGFMGLDIGPSSSQELSRLLCTAKTVLWNGPMGVFEFSNFAAGTRAVATTLAEQTKQAGLISVLGGGDTVAAIEQFGFAPTQFTHVSTGGGASLEFLEGKVLPGVAVLEDAPVAAAV